MFAQAGQMAAKKGNRKTTERANIRAKKPSVIAPAIARAMRPGQLRAQAARGRMVWLRQPPGPRQAEAR